MSDNPYRLYVYHENGRNYAKIKLYVGNDMSTAMLRAADIIDALATGYPGRFTFALYHVQQDRKLTLVETGRVFHTKGADRE